MINFSHFYWEKCLKKKMWSCIRFQSHNFLFSLENFISSLNHKWWNQTHKNGIEWAMECFFFFFCYYFVYMFVQKCSFAICYNFDSIETKEERDWKRKRIVAESLTKNLLFILLRWINLLWHTRRTSANATQQKGQTSIKWTASLQTFATKRWKPTHKKNK